MKKISLLFLTCFLSITVFAVDSIILDFESSTIPSTIGSWLNYSTSGVSASTWSSPNPKIDAINGTTNCYKISKGSTDPYWTGLEMNLLTTIPITESNKYLHVLVYKTNNSKFAVTFTPDGGIQSPEIWQSNSTTDGWIDFVVAIPVKTNLKMFAIKIDGVAGDYYFDQIFLSDNANCRIRTQISINPTLKNQVIEGWGGSLCHWANIMGGYSDTKIKTICDWITDPINGLNMNVFRFNIGGGDDPTHTHMAAAPNMPGYKASLTEPYNWNQDVKQRKILQQLIASRIEKFGSNDIQLVAFSNSPPYWMTKSGCSSGSVEGNVTNLKSDMLDDFADYLTTVTKYYHDNLGITFNYLEPFNEPDGGWWKALGASEGCFFTTSEQISVIREVYALLSAKNMLSYCNITANDANNINGGYNALVAYKNAGDILPKISLISVHSYGGTQRSNMVHFTKTNNKKIWQTESGPLNTGGTDEFQRMTMSDRIITDIREMKCSAWIDWQLAALTNPTWGLLQGEISNVFNPISKGMGFYIRAQYSRFIKTGYTIIDNSAYNSLTAVSPDEKELVIVISNIDQITQKYKADLSKFSNFGKVKQYRTRAVESFGIKNSLDMFTIAENTFDYDALSESVTTFVIPINQAPAAINDIEDSEQNIYYSQGILYTNITTAKPLTINIYTSTGQKINSIHNVSGQGALELKLKAGFYIINTKAANNKTISRKIQVN